MTRHGDQPIAIGWNLSKKIMRVTEKISFGTDPMSVNCCMGSKFCVKQVQGTGYIFVGVTIQNWNVW